MRRATLRPSLALARPVGISSQPASLTVATTASASFGVTASGNGPLNYQWRKDGGNLSGETNATLTLNEVQTSQAGRYSVVISNAFGSVTSNEAVLTVIPLAVGNILPL